MLIDFETLHSTYLIAYEANRQWQYAPINPNNPQTGTFPSSHQVFSNHGLQIAVYIYNTVSESQVCTGVKHCLHLNFTHKADGKYLLAKDEFKIPFNLDLGVAGELYGLAQGHTDTFTYSAIRAGRAPKRLFGKTLFKDGRRFVTLKAEFSKAGTPIKIEVELDRASQIALAAHCLGYGKLLYPALSDSSIQSLLSEVRPDFRACAVDSSVDSSTSGLDEPDRTHGESTNSLRACAETVSVLTPQSLESSERLKRAIWAIGNQKWPRMEIETLKRIQTIADPERAQQLVDQANKGDFRGWDSYLP
ncbi:hypothetical protein GIW05_01015 [Pseudomonas syringae]|uniref:hypothetical protein n=1 Tax=Pseudomonas syringae TaxID=317 RepID=UPI001F31634A|nr:hypothetical protein [Pseudomonas syringae]MCF5382103.1 hypothetical protein [Pseudomonas syringae]MCF5422932.1 hypothetical protein [Pseudomonas syringae]MCF5455444.1 hypothetical protein [Pseudomonas syringae]MCF5460187.1 hypothetical protein [Pseudomonas syringae]